MASREFQKLCERVCTHACLFKESKQPRKVITLSAEQNENRNGVCVHVCVCEFLLFKNTAPVQAGTHTPTHLDRTKC